MYDFHVPTIRDKAYDDPDYLYAVIQFVLHSIRRQFHTVSTDNQLMTVQREGLVYAKENIKPLYGITFSNLSLEEKLMEVLKIKGLNLVKASFVLQLTGHEIGCIDSHNSNIMGIDSNTLVMNKKAVTPDRSKIWQYIGMCQSTEMGGAKKMWNRWCDKIAAEYEDYFTDGYTVSLKHLTTINDMYKENKG